VTTEEDKDQRCILIIGGINIFLPSIPTRATVCVARERVMQEASKEEAMGPNVFKTNNACVACARERRQTTKIVMEKEKEQTLKYSQEMGKEEHSVELLINCSKGDEQRTTTELEPVVGEREREDSMDFTNLYK